VGTPALAPLDATAPICAMVSRPRGRVHDPEHGRRRRPGLTDEFETLVYQAIVD
jgi:hypothetical protein